MIYTALFKGINVGGKNSVKMADLRQMLMDIGFSHVKTYIQSGNVVFESDDSPERIKDKIISHFNPLFDFSPNVILRNHNAMMSIIASLPYSNREINDAKSVDPNVSHLYVYFLNESVDLNDIKKLNASDPLNDDVRLSKGVIYLLCKKSIRLSKAAIHIAKQYDSATARNWKTVNRVYELMKSIQ